MQPGKLQLQKGLIYGMFVLNLAVVGYFWQQGSGLETVSSFHGLITGVGRLCGLLGAFFIITDFLLMARLPFLEHTLGRPLQTKFHKWAGYTAYCLILSHFSLVITGYAITARINVIDQFLIFFNTYPDVDLAVIAIILLTAVVGLSIWFVRRRVKYETWFWVHMLSYIAILLAFFHQLKVGPDFIGQPLFVDYWYFLYIALLVLMVLYRFMVPVWRSWSHRLRVEKIVPETHDTYSIYVSGRNLETLAFQGGQFAIWWFLDKHRWWQGHPFSLSMAPNGRRLRLTFKQSGDFTQDLSNIEPGTPIFMDGPYGIFTAGSITKPKLLMIAGGIGLTPVIGMLEEAVKSSHDIVILYAARTQADLALRGELETIAKRAGVKLIYVLSDEPTFKGEKGILTQDKIAQLVPDAKDRQVFLCGPPPMMKALTQNLHALGVSKDLILTEDFAF